MPVETCLPDERGLLIARHARNRDGATEQRRVGFAEQMGVRVNFGEQALGNVEQPQQFGIPATLVDVVEHRPSGIGPVRCVDTAPGQSPQQEGVNGACRQSAASRTLTRSGNIVQQPFDLAG
jgi:hypothetical protein